MAGLLSATQLTALQTAANKTLDKTADIYRKTSPSADGYGSSTPNYTKIASAVACGLAQPTATHLQNYDYMIGSEASWLVRFPVGTDVRYQDHLVIGSSTLEVHVLLTPRSYEIFHTVIAAEII
jgi:hypothetical protein